jgi:hypothetical protein
LIVSAIFSRRPSIGKKEGEMARYFCGICGQEHEDLSGIELASEHPDAYFVIPEGERERRVSYNGDICVIDQNACFIRGVLPVPYADAEGAYHWGMWARIEKQDLRHYLEIWNIDDAAAEQEPGCSGWLANSIPGYPDSLGLPIKVRFRANNQRPHFWVVPENHALSEAQRTGLPQRHFHMVTELLISYPGLRGGLAMEDFYVLRHYLNHWGKAGRLQGWWGSKEPFREPPGRIYVAGFQLNTDRGPMWVYATIGMSRSPMPYPAGWEGDRSELRAEVYMYTYEQRDDLTEQLINIAEYPFVEGTFLWSTHRMHAPGGGLIPGTSLRDALFIPPSDTGEPPEFDYARDHEGHEIAILCVVPLYESETRLGQQSGSEAIVQLFAQQGVDHADLRRKPAVASEEPERPKGLFARLSLRKRG